MASSLSIMQEYGIVEMARIRYYLKVLAIALHYYSI